MIFDLSIGREQAENIFQLSRKFSLLTTSHVTREENGDGRPLTRLNQSPQKTGSQNTPLGEQSQTEVYPGFMGISVYTIGRGGCLRRKKKKIYIYIYVIMDTKWPEPLSDTLYNKLCIK